MNSAFEGVDKAALGNLKKRVGIFTGRLFIPGSWHQYLTFKNPYTTSFDGMSI